MSDLQHVGTTRLLTRILIYLKENPNSNKTNIISSISNAWSSKKILDSLQWLLNHKLVKASSSKHGLTLYSINKNFEELK